MKILVVDNFFLTSISRYKIILKIKFFIKRIYIETIKKKINSCHPDIILVPSQLKIELTKTFNKIRIIGYDDEIISLRENINHRYIHDLKQQLFFQLKLKKKDLGIISLIFQILDIRYTDKIFHEYFVYISLIKSLVEENKCDQIFTLGSSLFEKYAQSFGKTPSTNYIFISRYFFTLLSYAKLILSIRMRTLKKTEKEFYQFPIFNQTKKKIFLNSKNSYSVVVIGTINRSLKYLEYFLIYN